jgi:hypothetical protein
MIDKKVIDQALTKIRDQGANYVYFFQNLNSPDWIEPLWQAGFFRKPPAPIREGNAISFPVWVESQYLVRIAEQSPEIVVKVIEKMEETENARVHSDILDISIKLPPAFSRLIVSNICRFLRNTYGIFVHSRVEQLIRHLTAGGQINEALAITRAALEFFPDPKAKEKQALRNDQDEAIFQSLEPSPRLQRHDYQQIIDGGVRILMEKEPLSVLKLTCDILNGAITLSIWNDEISKRDGNDASISWRPAIEDHSQNSDYFYKQFLVPVIRDSAVRFLEFHSGDFEDVAQVLQKFHWDIFTRIYIHVCRVCPEAAGKQRIQKLLTDHKFFNNYRFKHEWSLLLADQFKNLLEVEKNTILGWIENEFDEKARIEYHKSRFGQTPSDELVQGWKKRWQRDNLYFISNDLPIDWKQRYELFLNEVGNPEHPDFPIWSSGVMSGSTSPKTGEQLLAMPVEDLIRYLKEWQRPVGHPFGESFEGLAAALQFAIKSEPSKFNAMAGEFRNLRPDYVKASIRGLDEAAAEGKEIAWKQLLELCEWVLQQNQGSELAEGEPEEDRHWRWSRMEIVRLVSNSLKREKGEIPFEYRRVVWNILQTLVEDAVPSAEYENKYSNGNRYGSLSINTTRGEAMHALFGYANWVRKHTNAADDINPAAEILEPLTTHLDINKDPTFTIRSVYSQHLGWLYHFHRDWLKANLWNIFPKDKALKKYRDVAWQTYVTYCNPWIPLFNLLKDEYERAVANVSKFKGEEKEFDLQHPDNALAQHLITLYWWGEISIDDTNSLLSRFFREAPEAARMHAIDYAGRAVWNTKGEVPKEILNRLQHLFDTRLEVATKSKSRKAHEKELSAFELWVYSRKFDESWTLHALEKMLILTRKRERYGGYILEPLIEFSKRHPLEVLKCVRLMVESNQERLSWYVDPAKLKEILRNATNSDNNEAKQIVVEIQDILIRQGAFEFRNLELPS